MLSRKTPLQRSGFLKRSRLAPVNRERAAKRRAECFGEQAELCRHASCVVCVAPHRVDVEKSLALFACGWRKYRGGLDSVPVNDAHHEPPRSVGGKDGDTVPLCRAHHEERHSVGRSAFERRHGVDLRAVARAIREELAKGKEDGQDG
jgi:hypothetical protein